MEIYSAELLDESKVVSLVVSMEYPMVAYSGVEMVAPKETLKVA